MNCCAGCSIWLAGSKSGSCCCYFSGGRKKTLRKAPFGNRLDLWHSSRLCGSITQAIEREIVMPDLISRDKATNTHTRTETLTHTLVGSHTHTHTCSSFGSFSNWTQPLICLARATPSSHCTPSLSYSMLYCRRHGQFIALDNAS